MVLPLEPAPLFVIELALLIAPERTTEPVELFVKLTAPEPETPLTVRVLALGLSVSAYPAFSTPPLKVRLPPSAPPIDLVSPKLT